MNVKKIIIMNTSKTAPLQVDARIKCLHKVSCPTGGGSNYPYYTGAIYIIVHKVIYFFTENNNNNNNNNKNKTIIIRVNNAHTRRQKQNTIRYTCFLRFDRATSLLLKWAVGPL